MAYFLEEPVRAQKLILLLLILTTACAPADVTPLPSVVPDPAQTSAARETLPASPLPFTAAPPSFSSSPAVAPTPLPSVDSLEAIVTAGLLSCRYGPGPEYLYLYALRRDAKIKLIGRTDGNNWVWVDGRNKCWVNARYVDIRGEQSLLPVVYPKPAYLPRSPYYAPTVVLSAVRSGDHVTVKWLEVPLRAGDEEDETMLHYIVEVWRCENGRLFFDPLATNESSITFVDQPGCEAPSHGRVFVQEKHGFAGPAEIPWPQEPLPPAY